MNEVSTSVGSSPPFRAVMACRGLSAATRGEAPPRGLGRVPVERRDIGMAGLACRDGDDTVPVPRDFSTGTGRVPLRVSVTGRSTAWGRDGLLASVDRADVGAVGRAVTGSDAGFCGGLECAKRMLFGALARFSISNLGGAADEADIRLSRCLGGCLSSPPVETRAGGGAAMPPRLRRLAATVRF